MFHHILEPWCSNSSILSSRLYRGRWNYSSVTSESMVWIKLPVLLAAGICFHRSITPPNPPPPRSESSSYKDLCSQSWVAWAPGLTKVTSFACCASTTLLTPSQALLWIVCVCEALTIYARNIIAVLPLISYSSTFQRGRSSPRRSESLPHSLVA